MTKDGLKFDQGKPRFDLLPPGPINELVKVLTHGAEKYTSEGWKTVDPFIERYYAACLRHLWSWRMGEQLDPESGLHHLAHAMCNLVFLLWKEQGGDDGSTGKLRSMYTQGELFPTGT
jgi:hypothetical protein